ncbi:MAG: hypothetical protein BWY99_01465 [Synergistetes bacterium ADurb.BinA166]|nr:MAG: hypothetical protein BWY99_01465 [Synergistetes bacterium ADurb.BinA166]
MSEAQIPELGEYSREIAQSVVVKYEGKRYLTPTRSLRERLGPDNNQRSIFITPSSYSSVLAGQQGPSTFSTQLNSIGLTFANEMNLEFTIENTTGSTAAVNPYWSMIDRIEVVIGGGGGASQQSSTCYLYGQPSFLASLDEAVAGGSFEQIAENNGISSTLTNGVFPPLYGASTPLGAGATALAILKVPEPLCQTELPLSLSDAQYTMRIFWSSNPTNYGPAVAAGDIALNDIRIHLRGLRLNERLHSILAQRCRIAPTVYSCCYWRRYYTTGVVLASGAPTLQPYLASQGWVYCLRNYFSSAAEGLPSFQPLITTLGNSFAQAAIYSQMSGQFVLQSESGGKVGITKTYMAERAPFSPLPRLSVYDFANIEDIVGCQKRGAAGAVFRVNTNDLQLQCVPTESATRVWFQLTLTAGFLTLANGSVGLRWFES